MNIPYRRTVLALLSLLLAGAAPGAVSAAAQGKATARVEQVKEIMKAKEAKERAFEMKPRGTDPLSFYRLRESNLTGTGLAGDGLHDPAADLSELQPPAEVHGRLPKSKFGKNTDWVQTLRQGKIQPRADLAGAKQQFVMDLDVRLPVAGTMNDVIYPHKAHTEWLACKNCHTEIFQMKKGANPITMTKIVQGQYCGVCHGKVAFPLNECARCHSAPKPKTAIGKAGN